MPRGRGYSEDEDQKIRQCPKGGLSELAKQLDRSISSVKERRARLTGRRIFSYRQETKKPLNLKIERKTKDIPFAAPFNRPLWFQNEDIIRMATVRRIL